MTTTTFGTGNAGNVNITATDVVSFDGIGTINRSSTTAASPVVLGVIGSGGNPNLAPSTDRFPSTASSRVAPGARGNGGNLKITTPSLSVTNGALLSANSFAQGDAGNLQLTVGSLVLDNQAQLTAETSSGKGGNITLKVQDVLLLRHNSLISTSAGTAQAGGNGGDIKINGEFIVAIPWEDSDIRANAFTGKGGNVQLTASGIFGTQFRPEDTPESDITASSRFGVQGTVQINTPDVDPSRGLTNLPTEVVDASSQMQETCPTGGNVAQNEFVVTGRGGLPDNPSETLSSDAVWTDLRAITFQTATRSSSQDIKLPTNSSRTAPLVEAQGWVINDKGQVVLTASASTLTPHSPDVTSATCGHS